jgi:hypothetical protein
MWVEAGVAVCFGAVVLFVGGLASGMWLHMIREGQREAKGSGAESRGSRRRLTSAPKERQNDA